MKYTNILEKLLCLFNIIVKSPIDITIILVMILSLVLFFKKIITKKACFNINMGSIIVLILFITFKNIGVLSNTFNSVVDYTFTNIYFPSVYVYLLVLIIMNVVSISSLFNKRLDNRCRKINKIGLLIINFILALILESIASNNIDLFKKESIFANNNIVVLLELSVIVFIIWIIANSIVLLSNLIMDRIVKTKGNISLVKNKVDMSAINTTLSETKLLDEYNNEEYIYVKNKFIPEKYSNINFEEDIHEYVENKFIPNIEVMTNNIESKGFNLNEFITPYKEVKPITTMINKSIIEDDNSTLNDLFSSIIGDNKQEVIEIEEEKETNNYTLNDYRIFNKMLKDIKEYNNSNRIVLDKNLEYRLITKYSNETYESFKKMLKVYSN